MCHGGGEDCLVEIGYDSEHGPRDQDVSVAKTVVEIDCLLVVVVVVVVVVAAAAEHRHGQCCS